MRATAIERDFGGELRKFDISPVGAWRAIEAKCGVGIGRVFARLWSCLPQGNDPRPNPLIFDFAGDDIREVIFQGLKGAGMADSDATKLMRTAFDPNGKGQFAQLAIEIISTWWFGLPEGEETAPKKDSETPMAPGVSTSAPSTDSVQQ